jgi:hypothetical protein
MLPVVPTRVAVHHALRGRRIFYLLEASNRASLDRLAPYLTRRVVTRLSGERRLDWFVSPRAPPNVVLYEIELGPVFQPLVELHRGEGSTEEGAAAPPTSAARSPSPLEPRAPAKP